MVLKTAEKEASDKPKAEQAVILESLRLCLKSLSQCLKGLGQCLESVVRCLDSLVQYTESQGQSTEEIRSFTKLFKELSLSVVATLELGAKAIDGTSDFGVLMAQTRALALALDVPADIEANKSK